MRRGAEKARSVCSGGPIFGLWHTFRQELPLEDYAVFYAGYQDLEDLRPFATDVAPRGRETAASAPA